MACMEPNPALAAWPAYAAWRHGPGSSRQAHLRLTGGGGGGGGEGGGGGGGGLGGGGGEGLGGGGGEGLGGGGGGEGLGGGGLGLGGGGMLHAVVTMMAFLQPVELPLHQVGNGRGGSMHFDIFILSQMHRQEAQAHPSLKSGLSVTAWPAHQLLLLPLPIS